MDFFFSLMCSPAAVAAIVLAMYYICPSPLVQGYLRFSGYILAGLQRKSLRVKNFHFSYYERQPNTANSTHTTGNIHPPTLLFLHGFTSNKESWVRVTQSLPKDWRILVLDMPGHGESSFDPKSDYSPPGMAEKIHTFVEALDLKSFHLIGESLGACVSATYGTRHPERLRTLTTLCPPITHRLSNGVATKYIKEFEVTGKLTFLFPKCPDEFQQMINTVLYNPSMFTFHYRMRQALLSVQMAHYHHFDKIQKDLLKVQEGDKEVRELAKNITMPTLIIWGQHDRICDPSGASILHSLVPTSQLQVLERCGHAITLERPRKCAQLLTSFISNHNRN
jgi:abhydrolase domain-containing protein 6